MADPADPGSSSTVEAMPLTRSAVAKLVTELQTATVRLEHMTRVAWGIARQVAPDVAADLVTVRTSIRQAGGSRAVLTAVAGEAADALLNVRAAVANADTLRRRVDDALVERRATLAEVERATSVIAADEALVLAEQIRALHLPLGELTTALDDARTKRGVIEATLVRRVYVTAVVAIETYAELITARLRDLRADVDAVHSIAGLPDATATICQTTLDTIGAGSMALPTIVWPKWSSRQSKNAKSQWVGDVFAPPELKPPTN